MDVPHVNFGSSPRDEYVASRRRLPRTIMNHPSTRAGWPQLRDDAVIEGADGLVVGLDRGVELAPDLRERLDEAAEPAMQLARRVRDLARGLRDQLLAPAVVDRPQ